MDLFSLFLQPSTEDAPVYDCRENCFLKVYDNIGYELLAQYIKKLTDTGFDLLQRTETDGNIFVLLRSDILVSLLYTPCDGKLRITAREDTTIPALEKSTCTGECQTTFYAFENDHTIIDCGMCLLVQCADYSFFIVDSGHYFQFNDNDRIYKFMRSRTPQGQKIVVCGWFITHAHTDHISKLIDFLKYNTDDVIIEGFYQNLIRADYDTGDMSNYEETQMAQKLFDILEKYPAPVYKLHTGMRFYIRNLCFKVLYTHEDAFPLKITDYNDSSAVLMLEAEDTKIFIPGDAAELASSIIEERYGNYLDCDIVQVAHHGHTGLSEHCYELLKGKEAVFPVTEIMFEQELPRKAANRRVIELADNYYITSCGTVAFPLPYKSNKPYKLNDETFEDFEKIKRIWHYVYPDEMKDRLYENYLKNGGNPENMLLPTSKYGWIEPKPPINE